MRRFVSVVSAMLLVAGSSVAQSNKEKLIAHTETFEKGVVKVTDGVYVAIGYALANSILIEGDDGVIIVDTTESADTAAAVKAEFEKITSKPIKAIVYTHNHTDHIIMGAQVFAGETNPDIYSHETTTEIAQKIFQQIFGAILQRSSRQFGLFLPKDNHINCGIGPFLAFKPGGTTGFIPANKTFSDVLETEVAGVRMKLVHAPGETDDQLYVYLPDKKVLMPGDNFYKSFPNLYAIRGTSYRDVRKWADSLDKIIAEAPEYLVPSHTRPVVGAEKIRETLTNYRDAIRFVHDKTVEGLNKGLGPNELVETVKLPERLAELPYLQEYYGTVEWSVRSVFTGYLGWFDGNATTLSPLSPTVRAERMVELAGGAKALAGRIRAALDAEDYQWAAELSDHLLALDAGDKAAKGLKAEALIGLGEGQISANGRNYYMTSAMQLGGKPPAAE